MAENGKLWIDQPGRDPLKIIKNKYHPGIILRQGPVAVFVDLEVADIVIDGMCSLVDEIESEVAR